MRSDSSSAFHPRPLCRAVLSATLVLAGVAAGPVAAQTFSRTEVTTYHDNTAAWVLGQVASVACVASVPASSSCNGDVVEATTFDSTYALPVTRSTFGLLVSTYAYDLTSAPGTGQRGTLKQVVDGAGNASTFTSWRRGVPQQMGHADGSSVSAVVNAQTGLIGEVTDELGNTSTYAYDAMDRLARVTHPAESTMTWNDTHRAFERVGVDEYGLAAGHWRDTTTTGSGTTITYYDALWRPVLERRYDAADQAGTQSFVRKTFDSAGRATFVAYPSSASNATAGVWTTYDALGRVTSVGQDTELSPSLQVATTTYLPGFLTRVTNPRGYSTTTAFQTFDQPDTGAPVRIDAPEGVTTVIQRDPMGKALTITRSGPSN